jgi:hypothetical protein
MEDTKLNAVTSRADLVQVKLWMTRDDVQALRGIATDRDQTISAVVRSLLKAYRRSRDVASLGSR